jgi:DNA-directed RNA polymerase subunit RPC12/RpoP
MTADNPLGLDVEKRTTRGRACPRCGGKIIPSIRAVYQASNPDDSFPIWQCERCGYEEMTGKRAPATKALPPAATTNQPALAKPKSQAPMLDAKGRALPADVRALLLQIDQANAKNV